MKTITVSQIQELVSEQVPHYGVTIFDVQKIVQSVLDSLDIKGGAKLNIDVGYIYNWDLSDIPYIEKVTHQINHGKIYVWDPFTHKFNQRNPLAVAWHNNLERWLNDQTVLISGREIKPLNIVRSFDRVPNEAMTMIASALVGEETITRFEHHAMGDGGLGTEPTPADTTLIHEIDRIDVTAAPLGGSLANDGTTVIVVGNHAKSVQDFDASETGVFDQKTASIDKMLDHTIYKKIVPHLQNQDAPGGTTILYQCSV